MYNEMWRDVVSESVLKTGTFAAIWMYLPSIWNVFLSENLRV